MARINAAHRRQLETVLRRVARAATVFIDGEAFKSMVFDPLLGATCLDEPNRKNVQYHVDHAKFLQVKRTLFQLKRLEAPGPERSEGVGPERSEGTKVGIVTWRAFKDGQAKVVIAMDAHPCPVRPGTWPISPAMAEAFAGNVGVGEFQCNGYPMLSICAPIRDSMEDVVGVVEIYAPLVAQKRDGLLSVETAVRPSTNR